MNRLFSILAGLLLSTTLFAQVLMLEPKDNAHADVVRRYVNEAGGHATLFRAPDDVRRQVHVFQPLEGPITDITKRIKEGFDPHGILNPGRMYEEI